MQRLFTTTITATLVVTIGLAASCRDAPPLRSVVSDNSNSNNNASANNDNASNNNAGSNNNASNNSSNNGSNNNTTTNNNNVDAMDADGDGVVDTIDVCPTVSDADQADYDADGVGDACDLCLQGGDPAQPVSCEATEACTEAFCEPATGCGTREVANGVVLLASVGERGAAPGQFDQPGGVAFRGDVFVLDTNNDRVQVLDSVTLELIPQTNFEELGLSRPEGLWLDAFDGALIADTGNDRALFVTDDGVRVYGEDDGLDDPTDVAMYEGVVYVLDAGNGRIQLYDADSGALIRTLAADAGLVDPRGFDIAADGIVWVADTGNDRVISLDSESGRALRTFEGLDAPSSVIVRPDLIWVTETGAGRVVALGRGGQEVLTFDVDEPADLVVQTIGGTLRAIVADRRLHQLIAFEVSLQDRDGDDTCDDLDDCPVDPDDDIDSDGVCGDSDNCPEVSNEDQADTSGNGVGDACDSDVDGDGVQDSEDNCPLLVNPDQANTDTDELGDACDDDDDEDGFPDEDDNCPLLFSVDQADTDGDGQGDACDDDDDGDGFSDIEDNCPLVANSDQADTDGDGVGDVCDPCPDDAENDADADGRCESDDNCPQLSNTDQADYNDDDIGDACDPCLIDGDPFNPVVHQVSNPVRFGDGPLDFFGMPQALDLDNTGSIYVATAWPPRIVKMVQGVANDFSPELFVVSDPDNGDIGPPSGLAVAIAGLFVSDPANGRVVSFDRQGVFINELGNTGPANQRLQQPAGLAVFDGYLHVVDTADGDVKAFDLTRSFSHAYEGFVEPFDIVEHNGVYYVSETGANRVRAFRGDTELFSIENTVSVGGNETLTLPLGLDIHDDLLYVGSDAGNVFIYDLEGTPVGAINDDNGTFQRPIAVAVSDTRVFVAEASVDRLDAFLLDGTYAEQIGASFSDVGELIYPFDAVFHDGRLYVVDRGNERIQIFSADGATLASFSTRIVGEPSKPMGIALDPVNALLHVASAEGLVHVYDLVGNLASSYGGGSGSADGEFIALSGIAIHDGKVYLADRYNNRGQIFTVEGDFVSVFGEGEVSQPLGVAVSPEGVVYMTDYGNGRVLSYTTDGASRGTFANNLLLPTGVHVDANGVVYTSARDDEALMRAYTASGVELLRFGTYGAATDRVVEPWGMATGPDGQLFIADAGNQRIQRYTVDIVDYDADGVCNALDPCPNDPDLSCE